MNPLKSRYPALFSVINQERYNLTIRSNILVFAGYTIATVETLIAVKLGLTPIPYRTTLLELGVFWT